MNVRLRFIKVDPLATPPGVKVGDVLTLEEPRARCYVHTGWGEILPDEPPEERAVLEPGDAVETAVPKRPPGRPRKEPAWHDDEAPGFKAV
jgi:hypothetical protein